MPNQFAQLFGGFNPKNVSTPKKNFLESYGTSNAFLGTPKVQTPIPTPVGGMSVAPKQSVAPISQNAGATNTTPVNSTPAKDAYVKSVSGETTTPSGARVNADTGALVSAPKVDANANYRSAFDSYLKSLGAEDPEITKSSKSLSDLQIQNQKAQDDALERPGDTLAGADLEANRINRNYSYAINAESNRLNALTGRKQAVTDGQKARLDFEKGLLDSKTEKTAPFVLSEGQSRYTYNSANNTYEKTASAPKTYAPSSSGVLPGGFTGTLSPLAQAVQNGTIALDKVPIAQRSQVAAELATSGIQSPRQQALSTGLEIVNSLLEEDTDAITGVGQNPLNYVGLSNSKALNLYNQLKGTLSLENRQQLKGQGAISDFEFKVLSDAASSLGRNLNNKDFKETLQKIKDVFEGKYRQTTATDAAQATGTGSDDPLGLFNNK